MDVIIENLQKNRYNYDEEAQMKDISLICKLLRIKYDNIELECISQNLIEEIQKRQNHIKSWFAND